MPVEVLFSEKEIQKLIDTNNTPKFGPRNTALIFGLSYWGLERKEICQLPLSAVMSESGELYKSWFISEEFSYNGDARELHTAEHAVSIFEKYIDWLKDKGVGKSNLHTYRQLNPDMKLFVNDRLKPFELTARSKKKADGNVSFQTRSLDDKLKSFIENSGIEGATAGTFRDSWIKMMYEAGCGYNDLKAVSGIRTKSTLDAKIRPLERELEKVFNSVFSRIK